MDLIQEIKAARAGNPNHPGIAAAQNFQRRAQFFADFIEAENSMGFHAGQEAARILAQSIDASRKGIMALRSSPAAQVAAQ
jgi:nitrite reductase (cytochrome c-552)